jgi:hypothetical protein
MSGPAVQLSFTLRTSPNVKTVHLVGSWDGYKNQLPLSIVRDAKPGSWKGTFRFQGAHALKLGSRYWYYYIVDGYHVSHDPAKEYTTEQTTGRKLNVLDVPGGKSTSSTSSSTKVATSTRHSRDIPTGRALSPGKIQHPRPSKPYASRQLREADYSASPDYDDDEELAERFAGTRISDRGYDYPSSPSTTFSSSSGSTFSDSGSGKSSPRSLSSVSSVCTCERYGITRSGQRVKLDCGGSRCGYTSGSSSECSESSSESEQEYQRSRGSGSKRQGTYVSSSRR